MPAEAIGRLVPSRPSAWLARSSSVCATFFAAVCATAFFAFGRSLVSCVSSRSVSSTCLKGEVAAEMALSAT